MIYIGIDPGASGGLLRHHVAHGVAVKFKPSKLNEPGYTPIKASVRQEMGPIVFAEDKVFRVVVLWVAVNVMNNLIICQVPPDLFLHDYAIFCDEILFGIWVVGLIDKNVATIRPTLKPSPATPIGVTLCGIYYGAAFFRFANCLSIFNTLLSVVTSAAKSNSPTNRAGELQEVEPPHLSTKQSPTEIISVFMWIVSISIPFFSEIDGI